MVNSLSIYSFSNMSYQTHLKILFDINNALELLTSPCFSFVFDGGLPFLH